MYKRPQYVKLNSPFLDDVDDRMFGIYDSELSNKIVKKINYW